MFFFLLGGVTALAGPRRIPDLACSTAPAESEASMMRSENIVIPSLSLVSSLHLDSFVLLWFPPNRPITIRLVRPRTSARHPGSAECIPFRCHRAHSAFYSAQLSWKQQFSALFLAFLFITPLPPELNRLIT